SKRYKVHRDRQREALCAGVFWGQGFMDASTQEIRADTDRYREAATDSGAAGVAQHPSDCATSRIARRHEYGVDSLHPRQGVGREWADSDYLQRSCCPG